MFLACNKQQKTSFSTILVVRRVMGQRMTKKPHHRAKATSLALLKQC